MAPAGKYLGPAVQGRQQALPPKQGAPNNIPQRRPKIPGARGSLAWLVASPGRCVVALASP